MSINNKNKRSDKEVKEDVRSFFTDRNHEIYRYGSPSLCSVNSPYHRKQIEVLFEGKYFHWVTNRAIDSLIGDGFLKEESRSIAPNTPVHFIYRKNVRFVKREISRRLEIIKRYSDPQVSRALGCQAEMLFSFLFRMCNFKIIDRNTRQYENTKWEESEHDLDFIIERDNIVYGVEIKNTLPYIEKDEFETKLRMCKFFGITPLFIVRSFPAIYFEKLKSSDGFALVFKTQLYPCGYDNLIRNMWNFMRLPVTIWKDIPEKIEKKFVKQHEDRL